MNVNYFFLLSAVVAIGAASLIHAGSKTPAIGSVAPDFTLLDETGAPRTLSDLRGQKVVVYFYPKDFTPGCTAEACSLRDGNKELCKAGIVVWGISYDSPESHAKFKEKHHLPFTLLSDTGKKVAKLYGAKSFFTGWLAPDRITILIDKKGKVIAILDKIDVGAHADQIIKTFNKS